MRRAHPLIIGLLGIVVAACSQANGQDILEDVTGSSASASSVSSAPSVSERLLPGDVLQVGNANAPVTMRLFVNHDSPYSRRFQGFMPMLEREFLSKGMLKIDIVPVAFKKYPDSKKHADMLLCAARQAHGLAMHSLLMSGTQTLLPAGMDKAAYDACLAAQAGVSPAATAEITLVPTYVIDGRSFTGVPSEADLAGAIRAAL